MGAAGREGRTPRGEQGDRNVDCDIAGGDVRSGGGGWCQGWEANVSRAFGGMVGEYDGWLTLDIGVVSTEVSKGAQCVKNGVEGVAEFVGQGGFAVFTAGKQVIAIGIEGFATGTC